MASAVDASLNDGVVFVSEERLVVGYVDTANLSEDLQHRLGATDASVNAVTSHLLVTDASVNAVNSHFAITDASVNAVNSHFTVTDASVNAVNSHFAVTDASVNSALASPGFTVDNAVGPIEGLNTVKFSNTGFGYNWKSIDVGNLVRVYCSGNGKYIVTANWASGGQISSDYGNTWTTHYYEMFNMGMSNTGKYMIINSSIDMNNRVLLLSSDYGANWSNTGQTAVKVAMSSSGKCILGVSTTYYTISRDYGASWTTVNATDLTADNIACCMAYDASIMYTIRVNGTDAILYKSTDYGASWNTSGNFSITSASSAGFLPMSMCCSLDGKTVLVSFPTSDPSGNYLHISKNSGATFATTIDTAMNYGAIAMSGCGQYMMASVNTGYVYASSNGGSTWSAITSIGSSNYHGMAMSHDGTMAYAGYPYKLFLCNNVNEFPAFAAYANGQQTNIGNSVIQFDRKEFDTHGKYDTSSYRWTPSVPGYYQINALVSCKSTAGSGDAYLTLRKNGTAIKGSTRYGVGTFMPLTINTIVYLSDTDYVDIYANTSGTTDTMGVFGSATNQMWVYFSGSYVRSA
jgi:hypothetical protein